MVLIAVRGEMVFLPRRRNGTGALNIASPSFFCESFPPVAAFMASNDVIPGIAPED